MNNLRYTQTHEWLEEAGDEVIIGITDHAQQMLGDLVFVELPALGRKVKAGEELGVVESVKAASDFYAPVSGVVIAVNETISNNPAFVNTHPYKEGWLVKMKPDNNQEIEALLDAEQYQQIINEDH